METQELTKINGETMIDFVTDKQDQQQQVSVQDQQQQTLQNQETNEPQSHRTRIPTQYIRDIQSGIGTADNRPSRSHLPAGIQISEQIAHIEGETEDTNQTELAMAAAVSKTKAMDPLSLKEAMEQPDYLKWEMAIHEELNNLQKAGTWTIVERPKDRNIVKNKWVFRIKKDAAGKIELYKARLIAKGFMQVPGVDYYDTWTLLQLVKQ